jgi:hypothetical protein
LCTHQQVQLTELTAQIASQPEHESKLSDNNASTETLREQLTAQIDSQKTQVTELSAQVAFHRDDAKRLTAQLILQREEYSKREGRYKAAAAAAKSEKKVNLARIRDLEGKLSLQLLAKAPITKDSCDAPRAPLAIVRVSSLAGTTAASDAEPVTADVAATAQEGGANNRAALNSSGVDARPGLALQSSPRGDCDTSPHNAVAADAISQPIDDDLRRDNAPEGTLEQPIELGDDDAVTPTAEAAAGTGPLLSRASVDCHSDVFYKTVAIYPCSHAAETRELILARLSGVTSISPCENGWKVTCATTQIAGEASVDVDWSVVLGAGVTCWPYRDHSSPLFSRCVFVTCTAKQYHSCKATTNAIEQSMSKVGDVLCVVCIAGGFCVELGDANTATTLRLTTLPDGMIAIPIECALTKIKQQFDRSVNRGASRELFGPLLRPGGDCLYGWIYDNFYARATVSAKAVARRRAALSADAQFCTVELFMAVGQMLSVKVRPMASFVSYVRNLSCDKHPEFRPHMGRRCATIEYGTEESARRAISKDWNLLYGQANDVECRPYRDYTVDVEARTVVMTSAAPPPGALNDKHLFQALRACGEIVDVVRLRDGLLLVEYGKAVQEPARRSLSEALQQWSAGCDVVPLYQSSAHLLVLKALRSDFVGTVLPISTGQNDDSAAAKRFRWCTGWQFPRSISLWLQSTLNEMNLEAAQDNDSVTDISASGDNAPHGSGQTGFATSFQSDASAPTAFGSSFAAASTTGSAALTREPGQSACSFTSVNAVPSFGFGSIGGEATIPTVGGAATTAETRHSNSSLSGLMFGMPPPSRFGETATSASASPTAGAADALNINSGPMGVAALVFGSCPKFATAASNTTTTEPSRMSGRNGGNAPFGTLCASSPTFSFSFGDSATSGTRSTTVAPLTSPFGGTFGGADRLKSPVVIPFGSSASLAAVPCAATESAGSNSAVYGAPVQSHVTGTTPFAFGCRSQSPTAATVGAGSEPRGFYSNKWGPVAPFGAPFGTDTGAAFAFGRPQSPAAAAAIATAALRAAHDNVLSPFGPFGATSEPFGTAAAARNPFMFGGSAMLAADTPAAAVEPRAVHDNALRSFGPFGATSEPFGAAAAARNPFMFGGSAMLAADTPAAAVEPRAVHDNALRPFGPFGATSEPFGAAAAARNPFMFGGSAMPVAGTPAAAVEPRAVHDNALRPFGPFGATSEPFGAAAAARTPFTFGSRPQSSAAATADTAVT